MPRQSLLQLIALIYDAAAGATPWAAIGPRLAALVDARATTLIVKDPDTGRFELLCSAVPPAGIAAYAAHFHRLDPYTSRTTTLAARAPPDTPPHVYLGGERLVPDAEFLRSEFWTDFCRPHGLRHIIGTAVPLGAAGVMPIGLHRPVGMQPFGEAERASLGVALPHLQRALQLRRRLDGAAHDQGLAALHALPSAVVVTEADGTVVLANPAAEHLAATDAGFRLARIAARVHATALHRPEAALLAALLRDAGGGGSGGALRLTNAAGAATVAVLATPLPGHFAGRPNDAPGLAHGHAMLLLRTLGDTGPPPRQQLLRELFALTSAEAEVAHLLAGGATKAHVAAARAARETTVRTQVRALLEKTGTANLRDLERLLASLGGL